MRKALILGIGGQDGSYLADILLARNYEVHGAHRRSSVDNLVRISHCASRVALHRFDLADATSIDRVIASVCPDELYNVADQDHVGWSQDTPCYSVDVTAGSVSRILESVKMHCPKCKVYLPSSATIFGDGVGRLSETHSLKPQSPYACAKAHALHLCRMYRERGLKTYSAILFNHDSPRRGSDYLLHRIVAGARAGRLTLSSLYGAVDIGFAGDYMEAVVDMMQGEPEDYIVATGQAIWVQELVRRAFELMHILDWRARVVETGGDVPRLIGDPSKLYRATGWIAKYNAIDVLELLCK